MANKPISQDTALTSPASGDLIPVVDISEAAAADKNKSVTFSVLETYFNANLSFAAVSHNHAWGDITSGVPTTLSGYGISDTKANFDSALSDGNFLYVGDAVTSVGAGTGLSSSGGTTPSISLALTNLTTATTELVSTDFVICLDGTAERKVTLANFAAEMGAIGGWTTNTGTVTSVSVTTANGVSGSVANATTTPAITLTLGAITPTSVAATGNVTGSNLNISNWNTAYSWGDHALAGYAADSSVVKYLSSQAITGTGGTTAGLMTVLDNLGMFDQPSVLKTTWNYAGNDDITDTGLGTLELAGSVIETFPNGSFKHVRITCTNTGTSQNSTWIYNDQGPTYSPGWRKYAEQGVAASFASVTSTGAVTGSNLNVSNWDTAYSWGDHSGLYVPINGSINLTSGVKSFSCNGAVEITSGDQATLEIYNGTIGNDAFMQFHVASDFACYFGLAGDLNDMVVGGWSMGANRHRIWHDGNVNQNRTISGSWTFSSLLTANGGISVAGNIAVTGTVDGRDVAADGTKLDGIEAGANNYTFPYTISSAQSNNTVMLRNASGYAYASYFNGTGTFATAGAASGIVNFTGTNGTDTFGRSYSAAAAAAAVEPSLGTDAGTVSTIVRRNSSGDINCRLVRPTYANQTTISGAMAYRVNNSTDNYIRFCSDPAAIRTWLGAGTGSGTVTSVSAGAGMTFTTITGSGSVAIDTTQTAITSMYNTSLQVGYSTTVYWDYNSTTTDVVFGSLVDFRFSDGGTFIANGDVTAYSTAITSDIRYKENLVPIAHALDKIDQITGYTFNWKRDQSASAGLIAQEVEKILPEAVSEVKDLHTEEERKVLNYDAVIGVLVEAIKELRAEIKELKNGHA